MLIKIAEIIASNSKRADDIAGALEKAGFTIAYDDDCDENLYVIVEENV